MAFQQYIPLMHAVCNQGMRPRHWEVISDETGIEVSSDSTASLKYLLDSEIFDHLPRVIEISDTASREWSIEKALGKMLSDWADLAFELAPWKETGTQAASVVCPCMAYWHSRIGYISPLVKPGQPSSGVGRAGTFILKGGPVEEAQMLLDDHIIKAQAMLASPFAAPFQEQLTPWTAKLTRLQDTLDNWLKCQSKWIYLEPIFGSDEIMKQMRQSIVAWLMQSLICSCWLTCRKVV